MNPPGVEIISRNTSRDIDDGGKINMEKGMAESIDEAIPLFLWFFCVLRLQKEQYHEWYCSWKNQYTNMVLLSSRNEAGVTVLF